MSSIAKPFTFSPNTTISSSQMNSNFDTIYNDYNGGISAANLATGAVTTAKIADLNVTTAKIADNAVTAAKIDWASTGSNAGIWWEELGRTTLDSAGDTITVSSIPARTYLMFIVKVTATGGTAIANATFNSDTGTNYSERLSVNGGADTTSTTAAALIFRPGTIASGGNSVFIAEFTNMASVEKLGVGRGSGTVTGTGDANAPGRIETAMKWDNTSAQISRIDVTNAGTGDFAIGSEVIVLGHN